MRRLRERPDKHYRGERCTSHLNSQSSYPSEHAAVLWPLRLGAPTEDDYEVGPKRFHSPSLEET